MGRLIVLDTSILDMAETAGQLARRYRTSHHSIEVPDYLIAATAHQLGAENRLSRHRCGCDLAMRTVEGLVERGFRDTP